MNVKKIKENSNEILRKIIKKFEENILKNRFF